MDSAATCEIVTTVSAPTDHGDLCMQHLRNRIFDGCNSAVSMSFEASPRVVFGRYRDIDFDSLNPKPEPMMTPRAQYISVTRPSQKRLFHLLPGLVLHDVDCLQFAGPCYNCVAKCPLLGPRHSSTGMAPNTLWTLVPRKSTLDIPCASHCLGILVGLSGVLVAGVYRALLADCAPSDARIS